VIDTIELRGWLGGYGPLIEVLEPRALRQEFATAARQLARMYGPPDAKSRSASRSHQRGSMA